MKPELLWLALTATATALMWAPNVVQRLLASGLLKTFATPKMNEPTLESEWALRAKAAHANACANLAHFGALVLVANLAGVANQSTALAAQVFFWTRLGHFASYTLGIPYARTLIWTVGLFAELAIAWQILAGR